MQKKQRFDVFKSDIFETSPWPIAHAKRLFRINEQFFGVLNQRRHQTAEYLNKK